ncbi:MAG: efflux transporter outer membrane subunit [Candidatus Thiothrix putei]|uniref:Efflux transporter outer membrane subunit n=1 Tax=Candidatus Thiothrix putei TaxID=3080811 RepID=A0AA95HBZ0_9GAMM|nr:MAG: efflux transporter outer membrane subunit [Candidatus Thiothrix putei]
MASTPQRLLISLAVCMVTVACTPASIRDTATPTSSTIQIQPSNALARKPIQAAWWQTFHDPLMTALIQEALQASPDIKTAQASLRAARAQRAIAGASLLPSLSSGASARRSGGNDSYGANLDASWEADIFGGNRLADKASAADLQATQASLEDVKASLAAEVASSYVNLRLAQARLAVSRQSLASRDETVRLIGLKQQAGLASGLETDQANLSLGQTQAQIPALINSVTQSQHALAILTGKEPGALNTRLAAAKPIPTAGGQLLNNIPANAIRQRPDIRAAEYKVTAAGLRVGEAKANLYPSFNLGGSLSLSSLSLADLLDTGSIARSLAASISAPLFDGGRLKQQVEAKDAAREQAVASYQKSGIRGVTGRSKQLFHPAIATRTPTVTGAKCRIGTQRRTSGATQL